MGDLVSDFERGRSHIEAILRLKLDFWQRLPWAMCGMASSDPAEAQMCAQQARASFDLCPQQQAHHRLTWEVLDPQGKLRLDVDRFAMGAPLAALSMGFQTKVAAWRFVPVTETTIEEKTRPSDIGGRLPKHQPGIH